MDNKYKEGEVVYAKVAPSVKLVIRRYLDRIYYCKIQADLTKKDLVYFERELLPENTTDSINPSPSKT